MTGAPALELVGIRKRFGSVLALDDVSLVAPGGTVHALVGENGAGKTTLMRIAFGLTQPDDGQVRVQGSAIRAGSTAAAIAAGLGMVQQHFALVPALTVQENIALGTSAGRHLPDAVVALADSLALRDIRARVGALSVAEQQRVEIVRTLARGARVLILDEPTATLAPNDSETLFEWLRGFRARGGTAILVTHKLPDALSLADEVTVLRQGRVAWSGPRPATSADELARAMLGSSYSVSGPDVRPKESENRRPVLEGSSVFIPDAHGVVRVRDATVRVYPGEILGVAGAEGSGYRELLLAMAGRRNVSGGQLHLPDEIGFIPDDRQRDGLLADRSIVDNVALKGAGRRRGSYSPRAMRETSERLLRDYGIRAASLELPVSTLSGGNQQRLVLARELDGSPPLLVAMNPTRGLDVAAIADVHRRLRAARDAGLSIVYYTADLDELLDVADRIIVVFDGRVRDVPRDRSIVGRAMVGAA